MGTIEYKDVLRVEVPARGALSAILRNKQLGFERDGTKARLGYMDSTGSMHYFEEGVTGPASDYWKPFYAGIKYDTGTDFGNVGIGCPETNRRLEVRDGRWSTSTYQIKLSFSDSLYTEMGTDDKGDFRINSQGKITVTTEKGNLYLKPRNPSGTGNGTVDITGQESAQIRLSYSDSQYTEMGTDQWGNFKAVSKGRVSVKAENGDIFLEAGDPSGISHGIVHVSGYGSASTFIRTSTRGNITGLLLSGKTNNASVVLNDAENEIEISSDVDFGEDISLHEGKEIKFSTADPNYWAAIGLTTTELKVQPWGRKLHLCPQCGDIVLETTLPGNYKIDMSKSLCLKLPMKTTPGDPSGEDGSLYYNAADKAVRFYGGSQWRDVLKWT